VIGYRAAVPPSAATEPRAKSTRPRDTRARIISAARQLFSEHGVAGTSMQMIADAVGVTKGALYFQFDSKDAIVIAVAEEPLNKLGAAVEAARTDPSPMRARERLLVTIVELSIDHRDLITKIHGDPIMARYVAEHEHYQAMLRETYQLLTGDHPTPRTKVRAAAVASGLASTAVHSLAADLDDDTLRVYLLELAHDILGILDEHGTGTHS
jgi:AcrR family transcriptional regulator